MTRTCATCSVTIRRTTGLPLCRDSNALAERAFRRDYSPLDADWMLQRSLFFGDVPRVIAAVRAEQAELVAVPVA